MDIKNVKRIVDSLNDRATKAGDSTDALKWSQAALNAANSYCSLSAIIADLRTNP